MTYGELEHMLLQWPQTEAATTYGTPSVKARGYLIARLREDGDTLVIFGVGLDEREMLIAARPELFYFTDHYRNNPMILARLGVAEPDDFLHLVRRHYETCLTRRVQTPRKPKRG